MSSNGGKSEILGDQAGVCLEYSGKIQRERKGTILGIVSVGGNKWLQKCGREKADVEEFRSSRL